MPKIDGSMASSDLSSDMIPGRISVEDPTVNGQGKYFLCQDDWEGYTVGDWVETDHPELYSERMLRPTNLSLCNKPKDLNERFGFVSPTKGDRYPFLMAIGGTDDRSNNLILRKRPVLSRENIEKGDFTPIYFLD